MKKNQTIVIAVQWKNKGAIGGMSQRFVHLSINLYDKGFNVRCLTSVSLAEHLAVKKHPALMLINDKRYHHLNDAYIFCKILFLFLSGRIRNIHWAGGGILQRYLYFIAKLIDIRRTSSFASRSLEMASYGGDRKTILNWEKILNKAEKIDILNPNHNLVQWRKKIVVSPCSFPARLINIDKDPFNLSSPKDLLCVFCGSLSKTKNPILAIDVFHSMVRKYKDMHGAKLIIFGRGELEKKVASMLDEINNEFGYMAGEFGNPEKYFDVLIKSRVFLSLQDYDNYPSQSLMEAMYCKNKIIATDVGDTSRMLPNLIENRMVEKKNYSAIVDSLYELMKSSSPSEENSKLIKHNFTIDIYSDYFLSFLNPDRN